MRVTPLAVLVALPLLSAPAARAGGGAEPWSVRTRAVMSGSSDHSEPDGYTVYSGISLEGAVGWHFHRLFAVELSARTESREIDQATGQGGEDTRLGSVELLPMNLFAQFRPPWWARVHPYAGAGLNLTVAWEKSGMLDSADLSPGLGPAIQLGVDVDVARALFLNLDLRWNAYRTEVERADNPMVRLRIDPISLGLGVGARF
jgi:outer membrane protein